MITISQKQLKGISGVHGEYVKLSNQMGVKLIHSRLFKSQSQALRSYAWKLAMQESQNLQWAFDSGVAPRSYGVSLVKVGSGFRVGVLMQHLGATPLANSEFYESVDVFNDISERLGEVGIVHYDLHEDNVMVYRGKCYAIDFSPESIDYQ